MDMNGVGGNQRFEETFLFHRRGRNLQEMSPFEIHTYWPLVVIFPRYMTADTVIISIGNLWAAILRSQDSYKWRMEKMCVARWEALAFRFYNRPFYFANVNQTSLNSWLSYKAVRILATFQVCSCCRIIHHPAPISPCFITRFSHVSFLSYGLAYGNRITRQWSGNRLSYININLLAPRHWVLFKTPIVPELLLKLPVIFSWLPCPKEPVIVS